MPPRRRVARTDALARIVLDRYLGVHRGEPVTIESWSHTLAWARSLVIEARRRGALPSLIVEDEEAYFRSIAALGSGTPAPFRSGAVPRGGAHVYLGGPAAFTRLLGIPSADRTRLASRHGARWWADARRTRTRAVRLAVADATPEAAAHFGVDRDAWESEVVRASLVDPARLAGTARRVVAGLGAARRLRIRHSNGTELNVERLDRPAVVDDGRPDPASGLVWSRVPAGVVIVPLRAGATDGRWEANRPSYDRFLRSPVASGARFTFRGGRIAEVEFDRGGEPFEEVVSRVGRNRPRAVALTIGVNPGTAGAPELESIPEGTVGLLIADAPYRPEGTDPGFSFLAALADSQVDADGRPWLRSGRPIGAPRG